MYNIKTTVVDYNIDQDNQTFTVDYIATSRTSISRSIEPAVKKYITEEILKKIKGYYTRGVKSYKQETSFLPDGYIYQSSNRGIFIAQVMYSFKYNDEA